MTISTTQSRALSTLSPRHRLPRHDPQAHRLLLLALTAAAQVVAAAPRDVASQLRMQDMLDLILTVMRASRASTGATYPLALTLMTPHRTADPNFDALPT